MSPDHSTPYDFDDQLKVGESGERFLDEFFGQDYEIEETPELQAQGADRRFRSIEGSAEFTVEYKTDLTAARTGNAFIETVSVDTDGKLGWACASEADWLLYLIPGRGQLYLVRPSKVRLALPQMLHSLRRRKIPNRGYRTHGLLIPLTRLASLAEAVIQVNGPEGEARRAGAVLRSGDGLGGTVVQREMARLFEELESAAGVRDWGQVRDRAEDILTLSAEDPSARAMYALADKRLGEGGTTREAARTRPQAARTAETKRNYPNAWEPWTDDDDVLLKRSFEDGQTVPELSASLQRTPGAVQSRLRRKGLISDQPEGE